MKGGELEEEDIDAIIARGEERTEQDNAKLQDQSNSLANFTLNGEERSLYEFGGQDWSGGADGALAINLPKRVEKKNYNEADMAHQRQERAPKMPRHLQVMPLPPPPPPPPPPPLRPARRRPLPGRRLCLPLRASTRSRWRALR